MRRTQPFPSRPPRATVKARTTNASFASHLVTIKTPKSISIKDSLFTVAYLLSINHKQVVKCYPLMIVHVDEEVRGLRTTG
jgi:hypothetical protein